MPLPCKEKNPKCKGVFATWKEFAEMGGCEFFVKASPPSEILAEIEKQKTRVEEPTGEKAPAKREEQKTLFKTGKKP